MTFSVIIPAKNESDVLRRCVNSIYPLLLSDVCEIIVVGDRGSIDSLNMFSDVCCFESNFNLVDAVNFGIKHANYDIIVKLDADIYVSPSLLVRLVHHLNLFDLVSCPAKTRGDSWFVNFLFIARDLLNRFGPLGRSSHGNTLVFRKKDVLALGGFRYDTMLHLLYVKNKKKIFVDSTVRVNEYRKDYSIAFVKNRQLASGVKRYELGIGFKRSLFHSFVRGRPFVVVGWLQKFFNS